MLEKSNTAILIIDVQQNLVDVMFNREQLLDKLQQLVAGASILDLPVIITEQYPKGLGQTVNPLRNSIRQFSPIQKMTFSAHREPEFLSVLENIGVSDLVVAGIEAHVCVYQTVRDLLEREFHVEVVADAVGSRSPHNRDIALQKMQRCGALLTTVEMVLFELQREAGTARFKAISDAIK